MALKKCEIIARCSWQENAGALYQHPTDEYGTDSGPRQGKLRHTSLQEYMTGISLP